MEYLHPADGYFRLSIIFTTGMYAARVPITGVKAGQNIKKFDFFR